MINILIGIISGLVSGMGMGGGTILILCLSLFMGVDQHIAQGANLIFFIPTSIVSIITNLKHKIVKWKTGIIVSVFGIIGAVIGAKISVNLPTRKAKNIFWHIFINYSSKRNFYIFQKRKNKIKYIPL